MTEAHDVVIIGAGIAGSALAIALARRGIQVLLLEKSSVHQDRIRGEWMPPWGVEECQKLGILPDLLRGGAHIVKQRISYAEGVSPDAARRRPRDLTTILPGVPGALTLYHPAMCDTLNAAAVAAGATLLRGVGRFEVRPGSPPSVSFTVNGARQELRPRLIVGADGRGSHVARQIGAHV